MSPVRRLGVWSLAPLTVVVVLMAACGGTPVAAPSPTPAAVTASAVPTASPSATVPAGGVRFNAQSASSATVRVEEHLAANLVNTDAVLATDGVTGTLTLNADGTFAPASRIVVDMTKLRSDQSLRDTWIRLFGVETNKFKEAIFVPERATGLPAPLPQSGSWTFTLDGTLTVHGTPKAVSWKATAKRDGRDLTGSATTTVKWSDFALEKPQAAVTQVVSVSDEIRLELAFVGKQSE